MTHPMPMPFGDAALAPRCDGLPVSTTCVNIKNRGVRSRFMRADGRLVEI
jgi:hypothetical protein